MCLTFLIGLGCGESAFGSAEASEIKLSPPTEIEDVKVLRVGSSPHMTWDSSNKWYAAGEYERELDSVGLQLKDVIHVTLENADFIHDDYAHYQVDGNFCNSSLLPTCLALLGKIPFSRPLPLSQKIAKDCGPDASNVISSWYRSGFFDIIISDRSTLDGYAWPFCGYPRALKVGGIFVATDVNRNNNTTAFRTTTEGEESIGSGFIMRKLKVRKFPSFAKFERAYSGHPYFAKIKKLYQLGHQDCPNAAPGQYDPDKPIGIVVVERLDDPESKAIKQPAPVVQPAPRSKGKLKVKTIEIK